MVDTDITCVYVIQVTYMGWAAWADSVSWWLILTLPVFMLYRLHVWAGPLGLIQCLDDELRVSGCAAVW